VADYSDAPPEIMQLARKLIKKNKLRNTETAKIKIMFAYNSTNQSKTPEIGYVKKAIGHWKTLTDYDFILILNGDWWAEAPQEAQEANLLHQLCHIGINPISGQWLINNHPIECFPEELIAYGAWSLPLKDLIDVVEASTKRTKTK
jgi:hypothetical protein